MFPFRRNSSLNFRSFKINARKIILFSYRQSFDDLKVGHVKLWMLGGVEVLLGDHHALLEEVLVDQDQILLGHQHPEKKKKKKYKIKF